MVHHGRRSKPSALALNAKLIELNYGGPDINFGYGFDRYGLNKPEAIAKTTNKHLMRETFALNEVPTPRLVGTQPIVFPVVGRPDHHRQGRGFWICNNQSDVWRALEGTRKKTAATHFMEYIDIEREFRVHVVNGKSIKISQKSIVGNHRNGARFSYPHDFNHKKTVRRAAIKAVEALGLDFGAVDVMWANDRAYVSEVNSAPCLTDRYSDTLERYARALKEEYDSV